ncbi:DEKNAAC101991 [Brettanomyces naardenensis]|uniref:D-aminoacyl-tRNA deacylase n=1 Tax=Brettanomyces naardenensis TaxID=13370 RepID=A0A448YJH0_BRENA|nr:DEKNAAC101991 [Brettanomyces naardenensis]
MKVVIQKVREASVTVENKIISKIRQGLVLLVGISTEDSEEDISKMANKVLKLRLFEDIKEDAGTKTKWIGKPWAKSIIDVGGEILSVSQFTLYASIKKGTKPDFHKAQKGELAKELYESFLQELRKVLGDEKVKDGEFGAMMDVSMVNEGPVTIVWDTKDSK